MSNGIDPRILSQLAGLDHAVSHCRMTIAAIKRKRAQLTEQEDEVRAGLAREKDQLTETKLGMRRLELEVEDLKRQMKTHNHRLNDISDSREFRALNDEVRYLQRQIGDKEEAILVLMEEAEKGEVGVEGASTQLEAKTGEVTSLVAQLKQDQKKSEDELEGKQEQLDTFLETVPVVARRFYERRAKRQDRPVVWIQDGACGACHHKLTPQASIVVRQSRELVTCESCGRTIVAAGESVIQGADGS